MNDMTRAMQTLIVNAIRIIEEHGWCQGETLNTKGNLCAIGGLTAAAHGMGQMKAAMLGVRPAQNDSVFRQTVKYIDDRLGVSLPHFNDMPGRKWETMKALMQEAADYLELIPERKDRTIKVMTGKKGYNGAFAAYMAEHIAAMDTHAKMQISADMLGLAAIGSPYHTATQKAAEHGA